MTVQELNHPPEAALPFSFSRRIAVDLGSAWTRLVVAGSSVRIEERSFVAVEADRVSASGPVVLAVGNAAHQMWGRTPPGVTIVRPSHPGSHTDFEVAHTLLREHLRRLRGALAWIGPEVVVPLPVSWADAQRRNLRESLERAGVRKVFFAMAPVAAAVGAELDPLASRGRMVVDVGASSTTVSIVALGEVIFHVRSAIGGEHLDHALRDHLAVEHRLVVGPRTAEALKLWVASAADPHARRELRGRDVQHGLPRRIVVDMGSLMPVFNAPVRRIVATVVDAVERAPADLIGDIVTEGILLVGGGARLRGLEAAVATATHTAVVTAEHPERVAVQGAGAMLCERKRYGRLLV